LYFASASITVLDNVYVAENGKGGQKLFGKPTGRMNECRKVVSSKLRASAIVSNSLRGFFVAISGKFLSTFYKNRCFNVS